MTGTLCGGLWELLNTMTYRSVKVVNLVIAAICCGLETYAYTHTANELLTDVDSLFVIISTFCIVESVFGILLCHKRGDCFCFTLWKYCSFLLLVCMGGALITETYGFRDAGVPSCSVDRRLYLLYKKGYLGCQYFRVKMAAGILIGINGAVYLFANPDPAARDRAVVVTVASSSRPRLVPAPVVVTHPRRTPRANPTGTTTTVITPGATTIVMSPVRNISPAPVASTIPQGPRNAPMPPQGPRTIAQPQGIQPRPLPSVPNEPGGIQAPFAPTAPPPPYFDNPPPYSTLPPNTQPPRGGGKF